MENFCSKYVVETCDGEILFCLGHTEEDIDFSDVYSLSESFICNAFSLQMLEDDFAIVRIETISTELGMKLAPLMKSAVGHSDTAAVLNVDVNRVNVSLKTGDMILVAQLAGGRLPEGSTTLPEGFSFKFKLVEVM